MSDVLNNLKLLKLTDDAKTDTDSPSSSLVMNAYDSIDEDLDIINMVKDKCIHCVEKELFDAEMLFYYRFGSFMYGMSSNSSTYKVINSDDKLKKLYDKMLKLKVKVLRMKNNNKFDV
jgi:hypothetical protein